MINSQEAEAFSEVVLKSKSTNLEEIALKIAQLPKEVPDKKRLVVITQGEKPVIVANGEYKFLFLLILRKG